MANEEHGYEALNLPERTDPDEIRAAVEPVADADALLTVGIGGSSLGAATITNALDSDTETVFLDNVDPEWVSSRLEGLPSRTPRSTWSRDPGRRRRRWRTSWSSARPRVGRRRLDRADDRHDWQVGPASKPRGPPRPALLNVPDGVPGRFSALSAVGMVAAAVCGHDLEALLAGAAAERETLTGSLFDCPAYAYGATTYALDGRGAGVNAIMPYAESLETSAEWFAQLWAESLGKDDLGQTPVPERSG